MIKDDGSAAVLGPSPRRRGSLGTDAPDLRPNGSIPAQAGEPDHDG